MKFLRAIAVFSLVFLGACAPVKPTLDYDEVYNFSSLRTYAISSRDDMQDKQALISDMTRNRIELAIEATLEKKGFNEVERQKADFLIAYYVITQDRKQITQNNTPVYYRCRYCAPTWASDVQVREYTEGTLIIDVIDNKSGKAVWRGSTAGRINPNADMDQRKEQINNAVEFVLSAFPPG